MFSSNSSGLQTGARGSLTLLGPPVKMIPRYWPARMRSREVLQGNISQ